MGTGSTNGVLSFPIRRSRWPSFWIGTAALIISLLFAVLFSALVMLLVKTIDGTVVILLLGVVWAVTFFLSYPGQRRIARALDLRQPGIQLADDQLTGPGVDDVTVQFNLSEQFELTFGWSETRVATSAAPMMHTSAISTFADLSQGGQQVFLIAEDSIREAKAAGWLKSQSAKSSTPAVSLWASDLVELVAAIRRSTPTNHQ